MVVRCGVFGMSLFLPHRWLAAIPVSLPAPTLALHPRVWPANDIWGRLLQRLVLCVGLGRTRTPALPTIRQANAAFC